LLEECLISTNLLRSHFYEKNKWSKPIEYYCAISEEGTDEANKLISASNVELTNSNSNKEDVIKALLQLISDYMYIMLTKGKGRRKFGSYGILQR
jgi:hypothetical protein